MITNKWGTLLTVFIFLAFIQAYGQKNKKDETKESAFIQQPQRIEFETDNLDDQYMIISGGENGLLFLHKTDDRGNIGNKWEINLVDTSMHKVWTRFYEFPGNYALRGYDYLDGKYYVLFNVSQFRPEALAVTIFDAFTGDTSNYKVTTVIPVELSEFEVVGNSLFFGGNVNSKPVLIKFGLNSLVPQVLPDFYKEDNEILDLVVDDKKKLANIVMSEEIFDKRTSTSIRTFAENGDLIINKRLIPDTETSLIDASTTSFERGRQYVAGTYTHKRSKYSRGLYIAQLINGKQNFIRYYNYGDLDNFFGYMKEKREKRIKKKVKRRKEKGKRLKFNYRLMIHEMFEQNGQYILIGEAYYPKYRHNNIYNGGALAASSRPFYRNSVYDNSTYMLQEYEYTHAVVVGFDRNGNLLWDHSFELSDIETLTLKNFVEISREDDRLVLVYVEDDEIKSKVIQGNKILEDKSSNPIKLKYKDDELAYEAYNTSEEIKFWYEKTFYVYGAQHIRNTEIESPNNDRKVFYINKIKYQ